MSMIIDQLLPKSFKVPEINTYDLTITHDTLRSFLVSIPVSDKLFGLECFITQSQFDPYFISEFHKNDLPIKKRDPRLILNEFGESNCFFLYPNKPPVFPFNMDYLDQLSMSEISGQIKGDELVIFQAISIKRHAQFWSDKLTEAYCDYVNGIEIPTNNKIIRSLQHKILELCKKLEGGYKRNPRIEEAEKKLNEEMFYTEVRFMVFRGTNASRYNISKAIQEYFSRSNYVNSWRLSEDKDQAGFFKDLQLRRPSTTRLNQILCTSELVNLLMVNGTIKATEPIVESKADAISTDVEEPQAEPEDKNNPFSIFPRGTKKNRENDVNFGERFNRALKKLKLINTEVVIQKISHGATLQKITFNLPSGLKLTDLTKSKQDIQTELALSNISFEQSDLAGCVSMVTVQDEREAIMVRDCVETLHFKDAANKCELPILIGVDTEGEVVVTCLTLIKHLIIAGTSGSGKSVEINGILTVLLALVSPKQLQVYCIDPKMVELSIYDDFPHVQKVYTDMDEAEGLLYYLCEQMDKRYELFKPKGYKNIQQYNRNEKDKLQYKLLVVDEMSDLMSTNPEVEEYLVRLAQKARAAGIHLILATQYPIREVITPLIKRNIISRLCFALDSGTAYGVVLDEVPKFTLLGKGDGVYRLEGIQGIHRFQGALIGKTEEEEARIIKHLSSFWKDPIKKEVLDLTSAKERKFNECLRRLKVVVLDNGETRMGELQKILNIRNETVKELMVELESLGWVKKHKSLRKGYELVLSEEQRKSELTKLK